MVDFEGSHEEIAGWWYCRSQTTVPPLIQLTEVHFSIHPVVDIAVECIIYVHAFNYF